MAATCTSLGLPSALVSARRKFTYRATGSSEETEVPSPDACCAHWSTTFPWASLTSMEKRCCGSEQSSASLKKATTIFAPSRRNPAPVSVSASRIASRPCGWRAPSAPAWTSLATQPLNVAGAAALRRSTAPGLPGATRSLPASAGKLRRHAAALHT